MTQRWETEVSWSQLLSEPGEGRGGCRRKQATQPGGGAIITTTFVIIIVVIYCMPTLQRAVTLGAAHRSSGRSLCGRSLPAKEGSTVGDASPLSLASTWGGEGWVPGHELQFLTPNCCPSALMVSGHPPHLRRISFSSSTWFPLPLFPVKLWTHCIEPQPS